MKNSDMKNTFFMFHVISGQQHERPRRKKQRRQSCLKPQMSTIKIHTVFIRLVSVDYPVSVCWHGFFSLFFPQELHQVVRTYELRGLGVGFINDVDLLPVGQKVIEVFDVFSVQVSRVRRITLLHDRRTEEK